jgi:DNA-binding CsgD family transcriptional regulator
VVDAFAGRERVARELTAVLDAALAGAGPVAMVTGEPGIGKTWLVSHAARGLPGVRTVWGRSFAGGWQSPFAPWVDVLRGLGSALAGQVLDAAGGAGLAVLARLAPDVFSTAGPDRETAASDGGVLVFDAIGSLLSAVARTGPVLVVLDDLQWADADSLRALLAVGRRLPRPGLAVVATIRDHDPDGPHGPADPGSAVAAVVDALRGYPGVQPFALHGFDVDEVVELGQRHAGVALPRTMAEAIRAQTGGNPFYLTEVMRYLVEERRLGVRDGRWTSDQSLSALGIPPAVRDVVRHRLGRLTGAASGLLVAASAVGGELTVPLMAAVADMSEAATLDAVDEAIGAGFLQPAGRRRAYVFRHAIVRQAVLGTLNPDRAARLHLRVAHELTRLADDPDVVVGELAYQYHAAGDRDRGLPTCLAAAARARDLYAPGRAAECLRMAVDLADGMAPERVAAIRADRAEALADALELDAAIAAVRQALDGYDVGQPGADEVVGFLARVSERLKHGGAARAQWLPLVRDGIARCGERRDLAWARLTLLLDPIEAERAGDLYAGRWVGHDRQAVDVARRQGDEMDVARTHPAWVWRNRAGTEELLARAGTATTPAVALTYLESAGRDLAFRLGDLDAAAHTYRRMVSLAERSGAIVARGEGLGHLSLVLALCGEFAESRQALAEHAELAHRLGVEHRLRWLIRTINTIHRYLAGEPGDPRAAAEFADMAASPANGTVPFGLVTIGWAVAEHALCADRAEAGRLAAAAVSLQERCDPHRYVLGGSVWMTTTGLWECRITDLADRALGVARRLRDAGVPLGPARSCDLAIGRMQALLGDTDAALVSLRRAAQDLRSTGHRPLAAIALLDAASVRTSTGDGEPAELAAAERAFAELGMAGWGERAARLRTGEPAATPAPGPGAPPLESPAQKSPALASPALASPALASPAPVGLSPREVEVLGLVAAGLTNREIADRLHLSPATVERHLVNAYRKAGLRNRAEATSFALAHGLAAR